MMSLRAVHAGTGYQYLLRSVATHDAPPEAGQSLADYYAAKGTPPGRWIGRGLAGLDSDTVAEGRQVGERQMAALYGEGLHPDADDKILAGESITACQLGRAFPVYTGGRPVLEAIAAAEKTFLATERRRPTPAERGDLAERIGRPFYLAAGGYTHASGADVIAFVNREREQVRQAVAGFDFTFSPVKSVSVLWALADEQTASQIAALHHEAVAEALAWAEDNAVYTRRGAGGIEQIRARGIVASEFTHFDTRGGDPDLHSHVLISNKVQDAEGTWRSLDGQAIFQMHQAISARYNNALQDRLERRLGVEFTARHPSPGKAAVWEVAGVDRRLCEAFSSRRREARPVYERLVADYVQRCGRQPSQRVSYELWQKAILDTRDAKKPAASLAEHRAGWRATAERIVGTDAVDRVLDSARGAADPVTRRPLFTAEEHASLVAAAAIADVTAKRAQFRRSHVDTAVSVALKGYRFASDADRQAAHDTVVDEAMRVHAVALTPPEVLTLPRTLTTGAGVGIDRRANSERYTTAAVLAAEQAVLDAAREPVAVLAPRAIVDAALDRFTTRRGFSLNPGQAALARHLVGAGTLVAAGVGPAGTGKSAAMGVVADAWKHTGGRVIGLAPSAAAATVLAEEIGTDGATIDSLVHTWRGHHPTRPGRTLEALPVTIGRGDMLLVDEAGMASTEQLAALTEIATAAGAVVRMVGDPAQLSAVAGGGIFSEVCRTPGTPELRQVVRMGADTAQAEATLGLRDGDPTALELYSSRDWITGGSREQMLTAAAGAYLADTATGRSSLVIASTNADVDTLNELLRAHHVTAGAVDTSRELAIARGDRAGVGDTVIARTNTVFRADDGRPSGRVINGQLFTVTGIADDGRLAVRDARTGVEMTLPAGYVRESVHLGYAATIHRAQGATVDSCHAVIDASVDRAGLYVSLTRGRGENHVYSVCEAPLDPLAEDGHQHSAGDRQAPTARQVLEGVLARDNRERSATETLREEMAAATAPERLAGLYRHGVDLASSAFTAATLDEHLEMLPRVLGRAIEDDPEQYAALAAAWTAAAAAGHDPRAVWPAITGGLDGAEQPGRVLAHRLRQATGPADEGIPAPPPRVAGDDAELAAWLATTREALTTPEPEPEPQPEPQERPLRTVTEIRPGARVVGMDLSYCDLRGRNLKRVVFRDCDLTGARFDETTFRGVTFTRCTLDEAVFTGATADRSGGVEMRGCSIDRLDLRESHWSLLFLDRCTGRDLAADGSDWRCVDVRDSQLSFASPGVIAEEPNIDVEDSRITGFDALAVYATDVPVTEMDRVQRDAVPAGQVQDYERARARVESLPWGRHTEKQLQRAYDSARRRVESDIARIERERAYEQQVRELRSRPVQRPGREEQAVQARHAELDARAEAIRHARVVGEFLARAEQKQQASEKRGRQARLDLDTLGPLAFRRRRDAEDRWATAEAERAFADREVDLGRAALAEIEPDPGPEHTWDEVLARAEDTRTRQRELDAAVESDRRRARPPLPTGRAPSAEDVARHRESLGRIETEIRRRAAQTPAEQAVEDLARRHVNEQRTRLERLKSREHSHRSPAVETSTQTAPSRTPAWSPSRGPDTGPDLGF